MSEQEQTPPAGVEPTGDGTSGDPTDPAQPDTEGNSPTTYGSPGTGDDGTGDDEGEDGATGADDAPNQTQPSDVPVPEVEEPDERPVWNVETHGRPTEEQRDFYRVIGERR